MRKYLIGGVFGLVIGFVASETLDRPSQTASINEYNIYEADVYGSFGIGSTAYDKEPDAFALVEKTPLFEITADDIDRICLATTKEADDPEAYLEGHIFLKHDTQLRIYNSIDGESDDPEAVRRISYEFQGFTVMDSFMKEKPARSYALLSQPDESSEQAPPYNRMADFVLKKAIPENEGTDIPVYHTLEMLKFLSPDTLPEACPLGFDPSLIAFDWETAQIHLWNKEQETPD